MAGVPRRLLRRFFLYNPAKKNNRPRRGPELHMTRWGEPPGPCAGCAPQSHPGSPLPPAGHPITGAAQRRGPPSHQTADPSPSATDGSCSGSCAVWPAGMRPLCPAGFVTIAASAARCLAAYHLLLAGRQSRSWATPLVPHETGESWGGTLPIDNSGNHCPRRN